MNMIVIVGLGNPFSKYENTRHNIGIRIINHIKDMWEFPEFQILKTCKATISKKKMFNTTVLLMKPETYMNENGISVKKVLEYYKIAPESLWVIHDELDLPFGRFKINKERGPAGHNGVRSIIESIHSKTFTRWRIGIVGGVSKIISPEKYVLMKFTKEEEKELPKLFKMVLESLVFALQHTVDDAMTKCNAKKL